MREPSVTRRSPQTRWPAMFLCLAAAFLLLSAGASAQLLPGEAGLAEARIYLPDDQASVKPLLDADGNKIEWPGPERTEPPSPSLINAGSYAFAALTGVALEDMSSGATALLAADLDDTASAVTPIGFDFWYDGVRQTLFSVNANGLMRLGVAAVSTAFSNSMTATTNNPHIAPYWDDLWLGNNGRIHYKVVGIAPNRKLVVEWNNEQIPRVAAATAGAGTFQAWLFESTGVIEFVYGSGIAVNTAQGGYSVGLGTTATSYAAVSTATNTVSYAAANDTQTNAIPSGTAYTFTPNAPSAPGALSFTAVGLNTMTLNWADTNANEVGYAIYRSVDGVSYDFIRQTAADATSSVETGLASNTTWSWRVVAVTEGGVSAAAAGSQATTTGTLSGTRSVGPTGIYTTLGAAVTDINTNGLAGDLVLELQAAYTSGGETFPLVINALGSPTSTITIRPESGATALSITSANTTATIDLNGATNVIIDGRAGGAGPSQLTLANTATAGLAVRFINGASRNTLRFLTAQGVNTSTTGGVVLFSTSTGVTGNNRNTIDSCDVRDGATTPVNGIASIGTATTALLNTANTVQNSNIYNFFSAGSATNGILVTTNTNLSNTGWTISNNRIFQTASRTYTTANTHRGIQISGGSDYTVAGNVVGYAAANGTGLYTMTGTGATGFAGIQVALGAGVNTIQGNTVTAISFGTATGALTGISLTAGAANVGTVSGNTVGSGTGNGAITLTATGTGSFIVGLNVSTTATGSVNVWNNIVGSLTSNGSATLNTNINGIQLSAGVLTASNNLVGSLSTANSIQVTTTGTSGTAQQVIGMIVGVTSPVTISGNTIANLTNAGTGTLHVARGLQYQAAGSGTITLNSIHDIAGASANVTVAGGGTAVQGIIYTGTSPYGATVDQNTIYAISATNTGAVSTTVAGIGYSNPTNGTVTRNRIYDLRNASTGTTATAPPMAIGILIRAALGSGATFANNMISLGDSQTTNTQFVGLMNSFVTNTVSSFYNAVHITGTAGGGALPSYGFLRGDNSVASAITSAVNLKNNIFDNTRTGGTGKHYAIGNVNSVPATGWGAGASDFNVLNSPAAGTVGIWGLATDTDFPGWKAASAGDASSLSGAVVPFTNIATADLHLNFGLTPTQLESGGTVIPGLVTDFDNQVRPGPAGSVNGGAIAPDLGADEFDGVPLDLTAPSIAYAALTNTTLTVNRTVSATITDANGVAGGANAPRIYYRKNAGAYFSNQCGVPAGSLYPCAIDYSLVGGVATGDVVDYFVVAQDTSGNVGANPSGGFSAASVNSVTTPPTVPSSYTIIPGTTGTKTVCASGCDFSTLTGAGGVFAGLNAGVATGNIVIEIGSDLVVGEDGSVGLNPLAEEPVGSNFTVRIYPVGSPRLITSTTAPTGGFIRLNGADRVTIDGSIGGTGTDRSLTITDTNTGTTSAVIWLHSNGTDGATGNTLKNLNVVGNSNTTTLIGIGSGGTAVSTSSLGTGNNNNTIQNNTISKVQYGIYSQGAGTAAKNAGTVIARNVMTTASPDNVAKGGIWLGFEDGVQVTGNAIDGVTQTSSPDVFGIALGLTAISTSSFTGNEVTNATVTGNLIGKVTNTGTFSAAGITLASATSGTTLIANNFIHGVGANGTSGDFGAGIFVGGGIGSTTRVYFNSVSMTGTFTGGNYPNYGLAIGGVDPVVDARDNVFFNTLSNGTGVSFAIGTASAAFTNLTSDSNDLFVTAGGGLFKVGKTGSLAQGSGTEHTLLGDWQVATGKDASSLAVDPLFVSTTDLHLQLLSPVLNAGVALAAVTVDFDGEPRPGTGPDIGADEIVQADLSITKTDGVATVLPGGSTTYTIVASNLGSSNANGAVVADTFPVELSCSTTCVGTGGATCTAGPFTTNINDTVNLPAGGSVTYTAVCTVSGAASGSISNTATVTPPAGVGDPNATNDSATDVDGVGSAIADLAITKDDGVTTATPGSTVTYTIVASNAGPSPVAAASVADTFPAACASVSYTSVAAGGATGNTTSGAGNIADSLSLPAGGSVTYSAVCTLGAGATGSLANTATIGSAVGDPTPGNNSATDTDTLSPSADLSITKTDGVTTATAGGTVTYTIVASNAGPSHAPGSTVVDTFPSSLSCSTTCSGTGGGTCTAGPFTTSINDTVNLPSGASVTYTSVCTVAVGTTGSVRNTATVATGAGVTDPTPGNNSATDEDTIPGAALFSDGFETGNLSRWGSAQTLFHAYQVVSVGGASAVEVGYDLAALPPQAFEPSAIAVAATGGRTLFTVVARRVTAGAATELSLEVAGGGASAWVTASGTRMRLDWSLGGEAGHVAVSLDGRLALWVSGFASEVQPASIELSKSE